LRYHTELYSFGNFAFVRGKEYWRLTSALKDPQQISSRAFKEIFSRATLLISRLIHGEMAEPELFEILNNFATLEKKLATSEYLQTLETILIYKILEILGYMPTDTEVNQVAIANITGELLAELSSKRKNLNIKINEALKNSHL
jgi:hypothetical protein